MSRKVVNLTPHFVNLAGPDGKTVTTIKPSGKVARAVTLNRVVDSVDINGHTVDIVEARTGDMMGLPEPQDGVYYLTSLVVARAAAAAGRTDVVAPDTGVTAVRDGSNNIKAVRRFIIFT